MQRITTALLLLLSAPAAMAQCGTILATGTSQNLNGTLFDGWSGAIPIGFAFPFDGATYTDMYLSDHGLCALNNGGAPAAPATGAFVWDPLVANLTTAGLPMIAPYWSDHNLTGGFGTGLGEIYVDNTSGTSCTVTWLDVVTYNDTGTGTGGTVFSVSMKLDISGVIEFRYDQRVNNDGSTFGALNAIVGLASPGVATPAASDLSSGAAMSTTSFLFEEFTTSSPGTANPNFDLQTSTLQIIPTSPGFVAVSAPLANCATVASYGSGCINAPATLYEELPAGGFDILGGTTITLLRTPTSYVVTDQIPGTFVPPTAGAQNVAPGALDGEGTFPLSAAMPIAGGTTTSLTITTKAYISLNGVSNGVDYTPTVAEFLAFTEPTLAPVWHDFNQTAAGSGLILFEEVGGFAYATWDGVYSFGGGTTPTTFQVQFELATGTITIVYVDIGTTGYNHVFGVKGPGAMVAPGATDISTSLAATIEVFDSPVAPLTLSASLPQLGSNWNFTTSNIDPLSPLSVTFFSDLPLTPGVALSSIGLPAPGCDINIGSLSDGFTALSTGGTSVLSWPLPSVPGLIGLQIAAQSACLTTKNQLGLLTSNGVLGTFGN